ncbi:cysteate racemase [Anaerosinus massiliensis]|uniref:aspartate/glutamate racemase family protein n=1 Tax=Massilibacillus massiliensis TaxID=1806837 RepID=UPI000AF73A66|nr:amino acid racemase [Massilibacillus massiliensis]
MKKIGIIGGMGPMATVDLFSKITRLTKAKSDQEHIHILVDSNTSIPDRTKAILENGEDPVPEMVRSALNLEAMGADVLLMSCNTAHYFYDRIKKFTHVTMLNMIQETAQEVKRRNIRCVGLLATEGTCRTGIYDQAFSAQGIQVVKPEGIFEQHIMDLIYDGVKAGRADYPLDGVNKVLTELKKRGAEVFILGCTELPLAFEMYKIKENVIDPTEVLARKVVALAQQETVA